MKRNTPIKRRTPLKRTPLFRGSKPIPRVSKRRRPLQVAYLAKRDEFLRARPFCEICGGVTRDVHHKAGRLGGNLLNESTWMSVCRGCHDYIHQHPKEARAKGWLA